MPNNEIKKAVIDALYDYNKFDIAESLPQEFRDEVAKSVKENFVGTSVWLAVEEELGEKGSYQYNSFVAETRNEIIKKFESKEFLSDEIDRFMIENPGSVDEFINKNFSNAFGVSLNGKEELKELFNQLDTEDLIMLVRNFAPDDTIEYITYDTLKKDIAKDCKDIFLEKVGVTELRKDFLYESLGDELGAYIMTDSYLCTNEIKAMTYEAIDEKLNKNKLLDYKINEDSVEFNAEGMTGSLHVKYREDDEAKEDNIAFEYDKNENITELYKYSNPGYFTGSSYEMSVPDVIGEALEDINCEIEEYYNDHTNERGFER